mgnify:CR=1 FL=1
MKTLLVAVCGLQVEGKIPLIKFKRNYLRGYWGVPGGKFDEGEFLPQAAAREIKEELGIDVRYERFHGIVDELAIVDGETVRCVLFVNSVVATGSVSMERQDTDEGVIEWFSLEQIKGMEDEIVPSDYRIIHELLFGGESGYWRCQQTIENGVPTLDFFERQ